MREGDRRRYISGHDDRDNFDEYHDNLYDNFDPYRLGISYRERGGRRRGWAEIYIWS